MHKIKITHSIFLNKHNRNYLNFDFDNQNVQLNKIFLMKIFFDQYIFDCFVKIKKFII
jgi:hypothetical protein